MKFAAVDIGNTRIKVTGFSEAGEPVGVEVFETVEAAVDHIRGAGIGDVGYCTTRTLSPEEQALLDAEKWWQLCSDGDLPMRITYATPSTLGPDRVAAALGAMAIYPGRNVIIADAGTALTIDLVSAEGEFLGGNISPGVQMRLDAMHAHTSRLPLLNKEPETSAYGHDTASAMRCGAKWGTVYEITGNFNRFKEKGFDLLILTGGDAEGLYDEVARFAGEGGVCKLQPHLTAIGLMKAYYYRHDKEI